MDIFFSGWHELLRTVVVGCLTYIGIVALLRVTGKRALAKMDAYDLVVTIALGSTLATAILSPQVKLDKGLLAFALLLGLQRLVVWLSANSTWFRGLVNAEPTLVLHRGHLLPSALKRVRLTPDEVEGAIRSRGHGDPADIEAVVLEPDGTFSVIPRSERGSGAALAEIRKSSARHQIAVELDSDPPESLGSDGGSTP